MIDYGRFDQLFGLPEIGPGTLLTGTLSQFGFPASGGGDDLEFVFNVTGGLLKTAGFFSSQAGVLLHETGFRGDV